MLEGWFRLSSGRLIKWVRVWHCKCVLWESGSAGERREENRKVSWSVGLREEWRGLMLCKGYRCMYGLSDVLNGVGGGVTHGDLGLGRGRGGEEKGNLLTGDGDGEGVWMKICIF